ncbi:hypothetical protein PR202_ga17736 [Eleusine coracana subsp. coracana]|uniref:Uncharacterized protein n=1 Tax=Eleusine coracana subsp. coracana TaxID=191504 RepID=A0AAV5CP13_ELECO|nr:hypothetical protein PR202_ga17489 [Eleusine coracana subsp. coracana]GJN00546.1 hypothetical protein PR202_ga17736 [Eleusine coracana subsp. coracana]
MGLHAAAPRSGTNILPVTVDAHGRVAFDAVVRQGENSGKIVYTSHADHVPKIADPHYNGNDADKENIIEEVAARTRAALQAMIDARVSAVNPASVPRHVMDRTSFVKYRPARQFNSGAGERVVRVSHAQEDPVMPAQAQAQARAAPGRVVVGARDRAALAAAEGRGGVERPALRLGLEEPEGLLRPARQARGGVRRAADDAGRAVQRRVREPDRGAARRGAEGQGGRRDAEDGCRGDQQEEGGAARSRAA